MFFHRAIGKVTFPIIAIAFMLLSVQTTWQFLNAALPHETFVYRVLGLAVFELGAFCWFSLLTSGAENVLRTIIALIMTVVCVGGVATAAIYEVGSQMTDIGFKMDPAFLQWTPVCVLAGFVSTMVATLLYLAASPHVAHRFAHMNATGQEPPIGSHIQMVPPAYMSPYNIPGTSANKLTLPAPKQQPLALPAPASAASAPQTTGAGVRNWFGNLFARAAMGLQNGNVTYTIQPAEDAAQVDANEPEESDDGAQEVEQEPVMQTSSAPASASRPARVYTRSSSTSKGKRSAGDIVGLLEIIDAQMPGKSAPELARMVGCDASTVRRWRAATKQGGK